METASITPAADQPRGLDYRLVWRWHFYAGLFCIPFVLWLSVTGSIFLFKPQIERFLDRPYDHLTIMQRASANDQAQAALRAVPGSVFDSYELPHTPTSAAQILVDKGAQQFRVYIHPQTLAVLHIVDEDTRLENVVFRLHGELLMGNPGSYIVETAASWAIVMILTGLFLWWPRNASGIAGTLYPRLRSGKKLFWRDIHAVTGVYVSAFALFLLLTGLPWAKGWGSYLKAWRHLSANHAVHQDWTTSSADTVAARTQRTGDNSGMSTMHDMSGMAGMHHMEGMAAGGEHAAHTHGGRAALAGPGAYKPLDAILATVAPLGLAQPVLISPPMRTGGNWSAKSDTRDRPLRVDLTLDPTGVILKRSDFHSKPWLDRFIGTGIAAHEGYLFGVANQIVSLCTVLGLITLCLSAVVMWWRRRPEGTLGVPAPARPLRFSFVLAAFVVALGIYMPFLGATMLLVIVVERYILRKIPAARAWLMLRPA